MQGSQAQCTLSHYSSTRVSPPPIVELGPGVAYRPSNYTARSSSASFPLLFPLLFCPILLLSPCSPPSNAPLLAPHLLLLSSGFVIFLRGSHSQESCCCACAKLTRTPPLVYLLLLQCPHSWPVQGGWRCHTSTRNNSNSSIHTGNWFRRQ